MASGEHEMVEVIHKRRSRQGDTRLVAGVKR